MSIVLRSKVAGYLLALLGIAAVTAICVPLHERFTDVTVALAMLLVVLFAAMYWGSLPALVASVAGMLCFNYFFLQPIGSLTIEDPENWITLGAFFATAVTVGQLSASARQQAAQVDRERKRFLDVLHVLPAYVVLLTPDYYVAFANRFFRERFGESRGRRCFEHLFGRSQPCQVCEAHEVLKNRAPLHWEWRGPDDRDYDVFNFPFEDSDGSALILEMGLDVTERKRAESDIRSLARLQAAVAELGQEALRSDLAADMLDQAVALIARNLEIEYCMVLELLPGGKALLLRSGVGWQQGRVGQTTMGAAQDSQAGYTLLSGGPVIVEDLRTEKRFTDAPLLSEHGVVSGVSVIIPTRTGPYGVLGAHTMRQRTFTNDEVNFLQAVAHVLGNLIERQRSQEDLRESELNLNKAQEVAHLGSWRLDIPRNRLSWSDEVFRMFGLPKGTPLTYEAFLGLVYTDDRENLERAWGAALRGESLFDVEHRIVVDGDLKWVRERAEVEFDSDGKATGGLGTVQDITARKRADQEIRRISRTNRALSRCNEAVIRATDEAALLQQICRVVVEEAGYLLCWVGRALQDDAKSVRPVAQAGFEEGYLDALRLTWADSAQGQGPTGTCIRTRQTIVAKDIATDPKMALWRAEALKRGYASTIAIPLLLDSEIFGAIMIYGSEPYAFGREEVKLLTELADDLAFGIMALRTKAQHERAEAEIRALNAGLEQRVAERTAELQEAKAALEQVREREFQIGFRIQQTLLLDAPPADVTGLHIAALSLPSHRIDGDFYAFFRHRDQTLDVIVGDVMGKGIPAALLGAATKSQFLVALSHLLANAPDGELPEPKDIVARAHSDLVRQLIDLDSFVTLCYARLDWKSRKLVLVDCGHTGTIRWQARTGRCEVLRGNNLPLGVRQDEVYEQFSVPFEAGDLIFFYSDGITEARNSAGELFGLDRLQECIRAGGESEPEALVETVRNAIAVFSGSERLSDDLTSVAVRSLAHSELDIRSDLRELRSAREFVRGFCSGAPGAPLESETVSALELAVHEAAVNIMKHAYHGRTDRWIHLDGEAFPGQVSIRLQHLGDPFDPSAVPLPAFDGSRESGFGAYIISRSVDEVRYYRDERGRSCVSLTKKS